MTRTIGEIWQVKDDLKAGDKWWKIQMPHGIYTVRTRAEAERIAAAIDRPHVPARLRRRLR